MIPAEAVEAAARVMVGERNWQAHSVTWCNDYLEDMRAALEAAAPYMLAEVWEEGRRADDFEVSIGLDRNQYMLNNEGEK